MVCAPLCSLNLSALDPRREVPKSSVRTPAAHAREIRSQTSRTFGRSQRASGREERNGIAITPLKVSVTAPATQRLPWLTVTTSAILGNARTSSSMKRRP